MMDMAAKFCECSSTFLNVFSLQGFWFDDIRCSVRQEAPSVVIIRELPEIKHFGSGSAQAWINYCSTLFVVSLHALHAGIPVLERQLLAVESAFFVASGLLCLINNLKQPQAWK